MFVQPTEAPRTLSGAEPRLRGPTPSDGQSMWALASEAGLDVNSAYAYVMWGEYHADTSVVALSADDRVIGFITGFRVPRAPDTLFVWQVAVGDESRRSGIGSRMLDELVVRTGATYVEATVTPSNVASAAYFRGLGARHGTSVEERLVFGDDFFPDGHEPEVRFRIGPLQTHGTH